MRLVNVHIQGLFVLTQKLCRASRCGRLVTFEPALARSLLPALPYLSPKGCESRATRYRAELVERKNNRECRGRRRNRTDFVGGASARTFLR